MTTSGLLKDCLIVKIAKTLFGQSVSIVLALYPPPLCFRWEKWPPDFACSPPAPLSGSYTGGSVKANNILKDSYPVHTTEC